jgi:hypothetical protein
MTVSSSIVAKFSTLAGGVFIEVVRDARLDERCFRFDENGNAEYAHYDDLMDRPSLARWYGHVAKEKDFILC